MTDKKSGHLQEFQGSSPYVERRRKTQRWKLTLRELFVVTASIAVSIALLRGRTVTLTTIAGLIAFGATVGACFGRLQRGRVIFGDVYIGGLVAVAIAIIAFVSWAVIHFATIPPGAFQSNRTRSSLNPEKGIPHRTIKLIADSATMRHDFPSARAPPAEPPIFFQYVTLLLLP
jgi:hypothetical protein